MPLARLLKMRQPGVQIQIRTKANLRPHPQERQWRVSKDAGIPYSIMSSLRTLSSSEDRINIAFYHGCVAGVQTDAGWVMEYGDHDVSIFAGHDFAMLGDIHKTNQKIDKQGKFKF